MSAVVAFVMAFLKAVPAFRDLFVQLKDLWIKEQLESIDNTTAQKKLDLEYIIALKQKAILERKDEDVYRAHRLYVRFISQL